MVLHDVIKLSMFDYFQYWLLYIMCIYSLGPDFCNFKWCVYDKSWKSKEIFDGLVSNWVCEKKLMRKISESKLGKRYNYIIYLKWVELSEERNYTDKHITFVKHKQTNKQKAKYSADSSNPAMLCSVVLNF